MRGKQGKRGSVGHPPATELLFGRPLLHLLDPMDNKTITLTEGAKSFLASMFGPGAKPLRCTDPSEARAALEASCRRYGGQVVPLRRVEDITIEGRVGGNTDNNESPLLHVPLRVYWPHLPNEEGCGPCLPVLLYAHGGGWVRGSLETVDSLCRRIAKESGVAVVSVGYRLSPEWTFPAHVEDLEVAYRWLLQHPGFDSSRLAVGGDSAGGQLITALQMRLHTSPSSCPLAPPRPRCQVLLYPFLDLCTRGASHARFAKDYGLSADSVSFFMQAFLGSDDPALRAAPELSPLNLPDDHDLSFFPPALVLLAEADPLHDDGPAFVERLERAGVCGSRHVTYPGTVHAFLTHFDLFPEAAQAVTEIATFLRDRLLLGATTGGAPP